MRAARRRSQAADGSGPGRNGAPAICYKGLAASALAGGAKRHHCCAGLQNSIPRPAMTQTSNRFFDEMARLAREENEALKARVAALEAKLGAGSP